MQPESFGIFFKLKNGPFLFKLIALAIVVIVFGLYKAYSDNSIDDSQLIAISVGMVLIVDLIFFVIFMLPYLSYRRVLQTNSSLTEDWKYFIALRSKEFLRANRYVSVTFTLQPTSTATPDQREMVTQFLKRWQQEGESLHSRTWKKRSPEKFKVSNFMISGHVAIAGGMNLLLRKIFSEVPALIKLVESRVDVTFRFGNEVNFEANAAADVEDDTYQGQLDRKWNDR